MGLRETAAARARDNKKIALLEQKVKDLQSLVDAQCQQLEQQRSSKYKFPKGRAPRPPKGAFCRVIIPDSHGSLIDPEAALAFLNDLEKIRPAEIVMLGDHLDCGGFLAQKYTLGYVHQTGYTFEDDCAAANQFLDSIQKVVPLARIEYLCGNHESRIESWCCTQAVKNAVDAEYLRRMFDFDQVLFLAKRKINWFRQGVFYDNLPIPATIKRGHCYFTHGSFTGQHAAAQHVKKFGGNVVFGHTHRADSYMVRTVKEGSIGGWCPGALCQLQPLWMHTRCTDWTHGYGLQIVMPSGDFLHINVPIVSGRSLFEPMAACIAIP